MFSCVKRKNEFFFAEKFFTGTADQFFLRKIRNFPKCHAREKSG